MFNYEDCAPIDTSSLLLSEAIRELQAIYKKHGDMPISVWQKDGRQVLPRIIAVPIKGRYVMHVIGHSCMVYNDDMTKTKYEYLPAGDSVCRACNRAFDI